MFFFVFIAVVLQEKRENNPFLRIFFTRPPPPYIYRFTSTASGILLVNMETMDPPLWITLNYKSINSVKILSFFRAQVLYQNSIFVLRQI